MGAVSGLPVSAEENSAEGHLLDLFYMRLDYWYQLMCHRATWQIQWMADPPDLL